MVDGQGTPLWRRWWVWCIGCMILAGVTVSQSKRLRDIQSAIADDPSTPQRSIEQGGPESSQPGAPSATPSDLSIAMTTGDSQVDAYLRGEMRHWQEDFGFDALVLQESIRCALQAFRPFLLFTGGREAVQEVCRNAHEDAERMIRRLSRKTRSYVRVGREEAVQRGAYVFNSIETAAADWLQEKTLENVDPEVPQGGWPHPSGGRLRNARGNIVNAAGKLIWASRPDLPAAVNSQLAAAFLEWVDEFQLSESDLRPLSRVVLSRLLVLQPSLAGEPPSEADRVRACDAGIHWLHDAKDQARPLFRRVGWINLPLLAKLSSESAAKRPNGGEVVQAGAEDAEGPSTSSNFGEKNLQAAVEVAPANRPALLMAPFDGAAAKKAQAWWADGLKMPAELDNSVGMKLVLVPAGEFFMGTTPAQISQIRQFDPTFKKEWEQEEQPQHRVRITRPLYVGAHEVTRGQFAQFVKATGYQTDAARDGKGGCGFDSTSGEFKQDRSYNWQNVGFAQQESEPVVNVSWNDVVAFCDWLSRKEKMTYRLPTEAEWEYACRAGTTTLFFTGDEPESLSAVGNVADATLKASFSRWNTISGRDGHAFTAPVGTFRPNKFGLFDMHGNVWEWCQDWYLPDYYAKSSEADPQGPTRGAVRVFRGGSWYDAAGLCRSAFRYWDVPTYRDYFLGFRVVAVPAGR